MFRKYSKSDLYRYAGRTDYKAFLKVFWRSPEYRTIFWFRVAQAYRGKFFLSTVANWCLKRMSHKFHIQLWTDAQVGPGLFIGHFGMTGFNGKCTIGKNFNMAQGVTIGETSRGANKGAPTIGDDVWVGPNAIIVGGIKIGNDVLIAPGAFVNFDVPDHSVVIGNPGVIRPHKHATKGYINRRVE